MDLNYLYSPQIQGRHGSFLSRTVLKYVISAVPQGEKNLLVQQAQRHLSSELQGEVMAIPICKKFLLKNVYLKLQKLSAAV